MIQEWNRQTEWKLPKAAKGVRAANLHARTGNAPNWRNPTTVAVHARTEHHGEGL